MNLINFLERHMNTVGFVMILIMLVAVIAEARKGGAK